MMRGGLRPSKCLDEGMGNWSSGSGFGIDSSILGRLIIYLGWLNMDMMMGLSSENAHICI